MTAKARRKNDPPLRISSRGKTVADDEASIREATQAVLEAYGYSVLSAADGAEAVALYAQHRERIAAVLTDMDMPVMDGLATIKALQKMDPSVKTIAISGMDSDRVLAEVAIGSAKAFLQKPFTAEKLLRTLRKALEETQDENQWAGTRQQ